MASQQVIDAARKNGSLYQNWFGTQRPTVAGIVDLLVEGSRYHRHVAVRMNSNKLLELMSEKQWLIQAGEHTSDKDGTNHYTVSLGGDGYHLRVDARGHLFEVSGARLPAFAPWAAPGTDVMAIDKKQ